ncbi:MULTISPECIES: D-alanine--D-alanine ligase [Psychrilyobacter]|uniref:D-alanine--D-alanine ligase n=1 Tax=Psychrilyobacter piezotolerans TaxID=2293438 RepID=A0ABX9KD91_9FUSO|nr:MULTISPECIES: D-alanine--D-alanine ligase [Psychrilyobacter]MCS5421918.1 D-alanine--D-alanine ligase [Psychrilyobacter sp. S5]NDI79246.1 D-alanine--D-alanine ligase [Psychrilyobacter piezotolerans]RDE58829.1 D-alanine--D-alanine ligase [Psychrilyobacter sp. S5]REI39325.1 D-alanine--D-alanine ligase [Psychrilyobacter piezotolerans]
MKIAVFMGGTSTEREVSLKTGSAVLNSLIRQGYDAYGVDLTSENLVASFIENEYDLAFLSLHGGCGEDGRIQGLLDLLGKKYTGSKAAPSAVAMDKIITKRIADSLGIRIPKTYPNKEEIDKFPVVIKPSKEGSSMGLYICKNMEDAEVALENLSDRSVIIEEYIKGIELTAGILNGETLGVLKVIPHGGIYDYESKYAGGKTDYEYPAKVSKEIYENAMRNAKLIHDELKLSGASRSDFILSDDKIYFLEVNTCPGMTETSLLPKLASLKNYTFDDVVKKIISS